uniref:Uncharacterized protein n=1 Tax=Rhizophora mucronata TaxID=61149 RepID=A0A2P2MXC7_RHIMU
MLQSSQAPGLLIGHRVLGLPHLRFLQHQCSSTEASSALL